MTAPRSVPCSTRSTAPVASFTGDGAYDQEGVTAGSPRVIPRRRSSCRRVPAPCRARRPRPRRRSATGICSASPSTGRMGWQKASGYNIRARVEAAIGRFKQVIGDGLRSRTDQRRATEVDVAVHALNRMLELGRPESRPHRMTPERGWGHCARPADPCNTAMRNCNARQFRRRPPRRDQSMAATQRPQPATVVGNSAEGPPGAPPPPGSPQNRQVTRLLGTGHDARPRHRPDLRGARRHPAPGVAGRPRPGGAGGRMTQDEAAATNRLRQALSAFQTA